MERNVAQIALFAALTAALGIIPQITLGFGVPITAQGMGVMLAGAVLGAKRGFLSMMLFLVLVAIGLPLLSGGRGGLGAFAAPTSGFLIAFAPGAWLTGLIVERLHIRPVALRVAIGAAAGGIGVLYLFGIVGMTLALGKPLAECARLMLIFAPGDMIKVVLTGLLVAALAKARPQSMGFSVR